MERAGREIPCGMRQTVSEKAMPNATSTVV
jgi:hypothetical protein